MSGNVQLEQEEPEMGISDGVRIEKYWNHFIKLKGPDWRSKVSWSFHVYQSLSLPVTWEC